MRHRPRDRRRALRRRAAGRAALVLGHELLGVVERDGDGFSRGDLVSATVRRSCGRCVACAAGAPDSCLTGDYTERGITALDGFASELVAERPEHLVPVPAALGRSACCRSRRGQRPRRAARAGGRRTAAVAPARALVLGNGAIGMLSALLLRLEGLEVWVSGLAPADSEGAALVAGLGARYVVAAGRGAGAGSRCGGFDVVLEATGDAE